MMLKNEKLYDICSQLMFMIVNVGGYDGLDMWQD
jgi:hypothetical protein